MPEVLKHKNYNLVKLKFKTENWKALWGFVKVVVTDQSECICPPGTADENTVCRICPNGTFSDTASEYQDCRAHRSCSSAGLQLLLKGATWHDSVCASCEGNTRGTVSSSFSWYLKAATHYYYCSGNLVRKAGGCWSSAADILFHFLQTEPTTWEKFSQLSSITTKFQSGVCVGLCSGSCLMVAKEREGLQDWAPQICTNTSTCGSVLPQRRRSVSCQRSWRKTSLVRDCRGSWRESTLTSPSCALWETKWIRIWCEAKVENVSL